MRRFCWEMTSRKRGGLREGFESTCVLAGKVPVYLQVLWVGAAAM
jgi:hypothetical protein